MLVYIGLVTRLNAKEQRCKSRRGGRWAAGVTTQRGEEQVC